MAASRRRTLASIATKRETTVITLIHRQETLSLLGISLERSLLDLYPQPRGREGSVEYIPSRPVPPGLPPGRDTPRRRVAPATRR